MLPNDPGQIATVLVAFAVMGGNPNHTSVGNETSVPPPATELIAPARNAAAAAISRLGASTKLIHSIMQGDSCSLFSHPARLLRVKRIVLLLVVSAYVALGADTTPPGCIGSSPLGKFRVSVARPDRATTLPVTEVASIPPGARLIWDPVHLSSRFSKDAEVAPLVIPNQHGELAVLPARKATQGAVWDLPQGAEVVALVIGPDGLNMGKVKSLVAKNEDLLPELASYAQQTSQVESLVQTLADSEQSGSGADAALRGFSSAWGVSMPKLDPKAPTNQQASALLSAVLPSAAAYDPLAPTSAQMQQTTGLAASLAGMFFGTNIGLAAGGAALVANLKSGLFPNTEFRSVYAQHAEAGVMAFCTKPQAAKSRTRMAYLWAYRAPGIHAPSADITGPSYLPLGSKSTIKLKAADGSNVKDLARAHDWRLIPVAGGDPIPITAALGATPDSLALDLTKANASAGDYRLAARWDWDNLTVGVLHLRPYDDFKKATIPAAARDRLVEGNGVVNIEVTGADFEFVEKAELQKKVSRPPKPVATAFELPDGARNGPQAKLKVDVDTSAPGEYRLLLTQADGKAHEIPVTVLPPNPKLAKTPVRVNTGESEQAVRFEGSGLDRVEFITSDAGPIEGNFAGGAWTGKLKLKTDAKSGERYAVAMKVRGLEAPVTVPDAIAVVGPRPRIVSARRSLSRDTGVEMREDELPAGANVGFAISVERIRVDSSDERPRVELGCKTGDARQPLSLSPDERANGATLTYDGGGSLYLSVDPGAVGFPGCEMVATVTVDPRGASDPFALGRVVRLPAVEQFTLTSESAGPGQYVGSLQGRDLDIIEKAGWDAQTGIPVNAIPAPVSPNEQSLRIVVPWPAPAPHAPLYIWLRGEQTGRRTKLSE